MHSFRPMLDTAEKFYATLLQVFYLGAVTKEAYQ